MADRTAIITLPNNQLRQRSRRVGLVDDAIKKLVNDMEEATLDWEDSRDHEFGVALAAVQVGKLYRIVIIRQDMEDKENRSFTVLINPEIAKTVGEPVEDYEGCLSISDVYGRVPRYPKVKVKAKGLDGKELRITAEGFLARVLQHEIDHTNGTLFIDHIKDKEDAFFHITKEGKLEALDYEEQVKDNSLLWE